MRNKLNATIESNFQVLIRSEKHTWISDEPEELEGGDLGPTPIELFLSSLASCKLITMRMYAQRKGWDIKKIEISLELIKSETGTLIRKHIQFQSDLPEENLDRLKEISNRCPVAKIITGPIAFEFI